VNRAPGRIYLLQAKDKADMENWILHLQEAKQKLFVRLVSPPPRLATLLTLHYASLSYQTRHKSRGVSTIRKENSISRTSEFSEYEQCSLLARLPDIAFKRTGNQRTTAFCAGTATRSG
jgi:hypothetical protein